MDIVGNPSKVSSGVVSVGLVTFGISYILIPLPSIMLNSHGRRDAPMFDSDGFVFSRFVAASSANCLWNQLSPVNCKIDTWSNPNRNISLSSKLIIALKRVRQHLKI